MLKWVAGDFKHTVLMAGTALFLCADAAFGTLSMFHSQALHVVAVLGVKAPLKEIILIVRVYVNKMAFHERGCGELHSRCLVITYSKYVVERKPT